MRLDFQRCNEGKSKPQDKPRGKAISNCKSLTLFFFFEENIFHQKNDIKPES